MSLSGVTSLARPFAAACVAMLVGTVAGTATAPAAVAAPQAPVAQSTPSGDSGTIGGPQLASRGVVAPAGVAPLPGGVNATGWVVADADSGTILAARNPHGRYLPASTLKTLTALTLLPKLTNHRQTVVATTEACNVDGTRVGLVPQGKYTVEMLFQCMLMMSGNDCATLLAQTAGGIPETLAMMNAEAHRLHAYDTHAATPSGLDGPGQASSAYDLALILRQDLTLPDFRRYNTTRQGTVPAQPPRYGAFQFGNDNRLLYEYPGTLAAKNGYTDAARHTYVAAAQRGKRTLIVTLMHGERQPVDMWEQAAALLNWGFSLPETTAPVGELVPPDDPNAEHAISAATSPPAPTAQPRASTTASSVRSRLGRWAPVAGGAAVLLVLLLGVFRFRRRRV